MYLINLRSYLSLICIALKDPGLGSKKRFEKYHSFDMFICFDRRNIFLFLKRLKTHPQNDTHTHTHTPQTHQLCFLPSIYYVFLKLDSKYLSSEIPPVLVWCHISDQCQRFSLCWWDICQSHHLPCSLVDFDWIAIYRCGPCFLPVSYCRNMVKESTYLRASEGDARWSQELYSVLLHPSSAPSPRTILLGYLKLQ